MEASYRSIGVAFTSHCGIKRPNKVHTLHDVGEIVLKFRITFFSDVRVDRTK
jgi:hypothetical protein